LADKLIPAINNRPIDGLDRRDTIRPDEADTVS
jgi:hypothetical protein